MKKAKVILLAVAATIAMSSCFIQKKDRCPQVGKANHGMVERK